MIPHAGSMCLLDRVVAWDPGKIVCVATSHRDPDNPLARCGRLRAVCGVEYAGQAMAAHGALTRRKTGAPRAGYLASLRDLRCFVPYLDECGAELTVEARLQLAEGARVIYDFELKDGERVVVSGRAAIALDTALTQEQKANHEGTKTRRDSKNNQE
jgi:predicted hotdog family 3-hydroxylacyl-ACP dehydratase